MGLGQMQRGSHVSRCGESRLMGRTLNSLEVGAQLDWLDIGQPCLMIMRLVRDLWGT